MPKSTTHTAGFPKGGRGSEGHRQGENNTTRMGPSCTNNATPPWAHVPTSHPTAKKRKPTTTKQPSTIPRRQPKDNTPTHMQVWHGTAARGSTPGEHAGQRCDSYPPF